MDAAAFSNRGLQVGLALTGAAAVIAAATTATMAMRNKAREAKVLASAEEARARWSKLKDDVVILHHQGHLRPKTCISESPFSIKLEAFLRVCDIKYVNDFSTEWSNPLGENMGRTSGVTICGEDFWGDSQLCVERLSKTFGKDLSSHLNVRDKAIARSLRVLLEDHLFWALVIEHQQLGRSSSSLASGPASGPSNLMSSFFNNATPRQVTDDQIVATMTTQRGLDRGEIQRNGIEDLQAISNVLGNKAFVVGDRPTDLDCALFGFISVILHSDDQGGSSVYKALVEKRLTNLASHAKRMQSKYFPDWDDRLQETGPIQVPPQYFKDDDTHTDENAPQQTPEIPLSSSENAAVIAGKALQAGDGLTAGSSRSQCPTAGAAPTTDLDQSSQVRSTPKPTSILATAYAGNDQPNEVPTSKPIPTPAATLAPTPAPAANSASGSTSGTGAVSRPLQTSTTVAGPPKGKSNGKVSGPGPLIAKKPLELMSSLTSFAKGGMKK